jgi:hypothetical protein
MYLDISDLCFTLAAFGFLCIGLTFIKAIVDVYILKKCDDDLY